jgi:hypothetical protein
MTVIVHHWWTRSRTAHSLAADSACTVGVDALRRISSDVTLHGSRRLPTSVWSSGSENGHGANLEGAQRVQGRQLQADTQVGAFDRRARGVRLRRWQLVEEPLTEILRG